MCSSSHRRRARSPPTRPMTRRTRTKTRRPKYLSLRLQLARRSETEAAPDVIVPSDDHHLACLLDPGHGGATLTDLLGAHEPLSSPSPASSLVNSDDADEERLARMALRGRERWVSSERIDPLWCGAPRHGLSLKLDYEEILTAWSGRGSLYIDGEGAQVVGDTASMFVEVGSLGSSWRVPEAAAPAVEGRSREARVRRYKEKRRSRLFAKRIRYEVRKVNAEKRPRMKGRFVKRKEDE